MNTGRNEQDAYRGKGDEEKESDTGEKDMDITFQGEKGKSRKKRDTRGVEEGEH